MNGSKEIAEMMREFRDNPPKEIAGSKVIELYDYEKQEKKNLNTNEAGKISLPKSNVLQFITEDGSKISARPSGTEPKIKFYFGVNTPLKSTDEFEAANNKAEEKIKRIITSMKLK